MKQILTTLSVALSVSALAQEPANVLPFQGQLADQAGRTLSPAAPSTLVFRLYRQAVGGVATWEESQPDVAVEAGRFSVLLGSRTELPAAPNFNTTLYLGITVDDGNPATADVEMRPRQALVPVLSASWARNAATLNGHDWSAIFGSNDPTGAIPASKLADGSLPGAKLTDATVAGGKIESGSITSNQIATATLSASHLSPALALDALIPPGTVVAFMGNNPPLGWFLCDGSARSRGQHARLFAVIGTSYGVGDGSTTFNLPDLRGRFLRAADRGSDRDPDKDLRQPMNRDTLGGDSLGSVQTSAFARHNHGGGDHTHDHNAGPRYAPELGEFAPNGLANGGQIGYPIVWPGQFPMGIEANPTFPIASLGIKASGNIVAMEGGATENRPLNVYVDYLIKY